MIALTFNKLIKPSLALYPLLESIVAQLVNQSQYVEATRILGRFESIQILEKQGDKRLEINRLYETAIKALI
ncbi:MAG: hypothetical protein COA82_03575 [Alkaliphilus sp.]|nr:MAG: hypothetical protein COA82_03575 [Alkaliphilus sp.]